MMISQLFIDGFSPNKLYLIDKTLLFHKTYSIASKASTFYLFWAILWEKSAFFSIKNS